MITYSSRPETMQRRLAGCWTACMRGLACVLAFGLGTASAAEGSGGADAADSQRALTRFEKGSGRWVRRVWSEAGVATTSELSTVQRGEGAAAATCLNLPVTFPGKHEFVSSVEADWSGWSTLNYEFFLPVGLPASTVVYLFTKDRDHLWRQVRLPLPAERGCYVTVSVPVAGPAAFDLWEACGHHRPWHQLTPAHLLEYGCSFELDTGADDAFEGAIGLRAVTLRESGDPAAASTAHDVEFTPRSPHVGGRCELSFRIDRWYSDPFDPDRVSIIAEVVRPDGRTETVRGFYYEGFLYDREIRDKTKVLTPYGAPCFKVRYMPRVEGEHQMRVSADIEGETVELPPVAFTVREALPGYKGIVKIDPENPRLLAWGDGDPFWGIGINVRSPYDTRYLKVAPYSKWENEGLPLYDRLFETYAKHGINIVEVWMSSWWLALEWINDAPGFHGVGYYNPYRAWMLDHIVRQAEQHGIHLLLVFNNHGKFGALNDTEWGRNPYNVKNGGFLTSCEEYFTNAQAKACFRRLCDYIVARWGCSPNILTWKLFTEIDLTGTSYEYYQQPEVAAWHKGMATYLREIDPYDHLISTHWMLSYHRINDAIATLPELDILMTDAYYQGAGAQSKLLELLRGGAQFAAAKGKPLMITEYGGSPHADSMGNLIKQAHLGIWTGFFHEGPVAPMFWWFALVDEKDLYGFYSALDAYTRGENRRGLTSTYLEQADLGLAVNEMRDKTRLYIWAFDTAYYFSEEENLTAREIADAVITRPALVPGEYEMEIWDCGRGRILDTRGLTVKQGQADMKLELPAFTRDIALKIRPSVSD